MLIGPDRASGISSEDPGPSCVPSSVLVSDVRGNIRCPLPKHHPMISHGGSFSPLFSKVSDASQKTFEGFFDGGFRTRAANAPADEQDPRSRIFVESA